MSLIIQPIQKIPRYPLLLEEMIKELSKDMHVNKKTLAALCIAKKNVERFLTRLNQALTINDIIETHEVPANLQCGLITCLQIEFGVNINEPTMLLVPSFSSHHGYRSAVSIFLIILHFKIFIIYFSRSTFTNLENLFVLITLKCMSIIHHESFKAKFSSLNVASCIQKS